MSAMKPYKFDEFYEAFAKSVSSDVVFVDGQVHIIQRQKEEVPFESIGSNKLEDVQPILPAINREGSIRKHAKGRLLDSADRRRLPWTIRALLEAQEADGSWVYSKDFEFIINGTAPPPMEGISGKMWATSVAITIWRQFPEYFELLETYYEKALLHADENLELNEELKVSRMREEEIRIGKLSLVYARRLPMPVQQLFVDELGSELANVFSTLPPTVAHDPESSSFSVGQLVESCRRRRKNGSALAIAATSPRWHLCRIIAINEKSRLLELDFLDGDCERERKVPIKFVRATAAGAQEARSIQFDALKSSWGQPIVCETEIARLQEARMVKLKPLSWDSRHHIVQKSTSCTVKAAHAIAIATPHICQRPRSSTRCPTSRESLQEISTLETTCSVDVLFQAAAVPLMQYDRDYARVQTAVETGARRYATAVLYRDRFHAFDELTDALVALVASTVDALEAIWRWKESGRVDAGSSKPKRFVWKGDDFIPTVRLLASPLA
ncbi:unnamed protein product [Phytophthora fragariaefolia]|uniref:Unnamed protein product n=1 Tax=Phytophthora fragariaefolia TaxID=1490495 RepID=A0A9W6UFE2_9STRA|nr:unnamed protein product [Phytophthora fragariaefolia]